MGTDTTTGTDLAAMDDPDLIRHWADARTRLALTGKGDPRHVEVKQDYDAILLEYRRRLHPEWEL